MHDGREMVFAEDKVECVAVRNIGLDEIGASRNGAGATVGKIVEDYDFESLREELRGYDAADVASTSGHQDAIGHGLARSFKKLVPTSGTLMVHRVAPVADGWTENWQSPRRWHIVY